MPSPVYVSPNQPSGQYPNVQYSSLTPVVFQHRRWGWKTIVIVLLLLLILVAAVSYLIWIYVIQKSQLPSMKHQSPIDIVQSKTVYDPMLSKSQIFVNYQPEDVLKIANVKGAWKISLKSLNETNSSKGFFIFQKLI